MKIFTHKLYLPDEREPAGNAYCIMGFIDEVMSKAYEATHEMNNTWLYAGDLTEIASSLNEHNLRIIGYATLSVPKHSMLGNLLDIGVVAEYNDGERIWCHCSNEHRKFLLEGRLEDDD